MQPVSQGTQSGERDDGTAVHPGAEESEARSPVCLGSDQGPSGGGPPVGGTDRQREEIGSGQIQEKVSPTWMGSRKKARVVHRLHEGFSDPS